MWFTREVTIIKDTTNNIFEIPACTLLQNPLFVIRGTPGFGLILGFLAPKLIQRARVAIERSGMSPHVPRRLM